MNQLFVRVVCAVEACMRSLFSRSNLVTYQISRISSFIPSKNCIRRTFFPQPTNLIINVFLYVAKIRQLFISSMAKNKNKQKYFIALSFKFGAKINSLKWKRKKNTTKPKPNHTNIAIHRHRPRISHKQWERKIQNSAKHFVILLIYNQHVLMMRHQLMRSFVFQLIDWISNSQLNFCCCLFDWENSTC